MQYIALLLPIVIGVMINQIWECTAFGVLLWWICRRIQREQALINQSELLQQLADVKDELAALRVRIQHLEQGSLTPSASPINTESESTFASPQVIASHLNETVHQDLSTLLPSVTPMDFETPLASSVSKPETHQPTERKTFSIRQRLRQQQAQVSAAMPAHNVSLEYEQDVPSQDKHMPTLDDKQTVWSAFFAWMMGGNVLLKAGVVILFLGLAFLLRLATEHIELSIGTRYVLVAMAGGLATVFGWRLQNRRREYGLILQGFGIAVLYLTSLAALKLHPLLPASVTFAAMVSLVVLMAVVAVRQNALVLAQVALVGGMAAPILVSDGSGQYVVLFTYLALLNTGVASMAWFKAWRSLNVIGFVGTFGIGAIWGTQAYTPAHFATIEPFLLFHWLLYTLIACLFARQKLREQPLMGQVGVIPNDASLSQIWRAVCNYGMRVGVLDSALLFGTALAAFGLQYQMVVSWEYAAAWSALGFALVYGAFAAWVNGWADDFAVLKEALVCLAVLFISLAIPLAFEQQWTASAWLVEAALVYVFGLRQQQPHSRLLALGVFALAMVAQLGTYHLGDTTVLTGSLLGTVLAAGGSVAIYGLWWQQQRSVSAYWERIAQTGVLIASVVLISCLPMLVWTERGSMVALALLAAVWVYLQTRLAQRVLGVLAVLSALLVLWWGVYVAFIRYTGDHAYLWLMVAAWGLLAAAYGLHRHVAQGISRPNQVWGWLLLVMALWQSGLGIHQGLQTWANAWHMGQHIETHWLWWAWLLFAPLAVLAHHAAWRQAQQAVWAWLPIFTWLFVVDNFALVPMSSGLAVLAAVGLHVYVLSRPRIWSNHHHALGFTLLGIMVTKWAGDLGTMYLTGVWAQLAWVVVPMVVWLVLYVQRRHAYVQRYAAAYWQWGSGLCALYVVGWLLYANIATPHLPQPLPYVPVVNPLELVMLAILWQGFRWLPTWLPRDGSWAFYRSIMTSSLMGLALFTLSAAVMRAWHFFDGVAWDFATLLASFGLQASLSIVWAAVAIVLMVTGNQQGQRSRWLIGASLMGVVVVKLFVVELGNSGGIARIVSFIVVGLLLLLVGWFAPVPPKLVLDETPNKQDE